MYVSDRVAPWFGIGTESNDNSNVDRFLTSIGMNWDVESRKVFWQGDNGSFNEILDARANVRTDNNHVLGKVSDKYVIVQNREAFSFVDYMIPMGLKILKGGYFGERKIWMVGQLDAKMLDLDGDIVDTFLVFTNAHDGKGSVKICITPIRPICQNMLNLAFASSLRSWSVSHIGDAKDRLRTAEEAIGLTTSYIQAFQSTAKILMNIKVGKDKLDALTSQLFPIPKDAGEQKEQVVLERRAIVTDIFNHAPDLGRGTGWDFLNAVSDYAMHYLPEYDVPMYRSSTFHKAIDGHPLIDHTHQLLRRVA